MLFLPVLHNLCIRFQNFHSIYTYCGIVLVAVNPYTSVPIYGKEFASAYSSYQLGELDPHIFAVAADTYRAMARYAWWGQARVQASSNILSWFEPVLS